MGSSRARSPVAVSAKRFVLLASRCNAPITQALVRAAARQLRQAGVPDRQVQVLWVPGTFELPVVAARLAAHRGRPHAMIALGALVRGQTPQYAVIAQAVAQGLTSVAVASRIPVTFGVIVADTWAQAKARAGGAVGNRGAEAAQAALEVLHVLESVH